MSSNAENFFTYTTWYNPLEVPQRVKLHRGAGKPQTVIFPPKEETQLPSEFDGSIQVVQKMGDPDDPTAPEVIVSGLAPLLVKRGKGPAPVVHEALDPAASERKRQDAVNALEAIAKADVDPHQTVAQAQANLKARK